MAEEASSNPDAATLVTDARYWHTLDRVTDYSVDASESATLQIGEQTIQIGEVEFLKFLYTPTDSHEYEEELVREMTQSVPVVCVAGDRGCGKTSALKYAQAKIARDSPSLRIVWVDIKSLFDRKVFEDLSEDTARSAFRTVIRDQVETDLFKDVPAERALLAWCFSGAPDETDEFPAEVVADLHSVSMRVIALSRCEHLPRRERRRVIERWLTDNPDMFDRFKGEFDALARTSHLVHAFLSLSDFSRIILVLDNVDRIDPPFQPIFLQVCNDSQLAVRDACTTVVAIRTENMRGAEPRPGAGGDLVRVVMPDAMRYPGILMPTVDSDQVSQILTSPSISAISEV